MKVAAQAFAIAVVLTWLSPQLQGGATTQPTTRPTSSWHLGETPKDETVRVTIDEPDIARAWLAAAEAGDLIAQNNVGVMYAYGSPFGYDLAVAKKWFRKAAEQGNAVAQFNLGVMYLGGQGKDLKAAMSWYQKAAAQGDPLATSAIGALYYVGNGVDRDTTKSAEWYERAARLGEPQAQFMLADQLSRGDGVAKDLGTAYVWAELARKGGNPGGEIVKDKVKRQLSAKELEEAERRIKAGDMPAGRTTRPQE